MKFGSLGAAMAALDSGHRSPSPIVGASNRERVGLCSSHPSKCINQVEVQRPAWWPTQILIIGYVWTTRIGSST